MKRLVYYIIIGIIIIGCQTQAQQKKKGIRTMQKQTTYGIEGYKAPEFEVNTWIDAEGNVTTPVKLADYDGKFKVLYCFQSWCPGCHSRGLPALQEMTEALKNNDNVVFLAIQTVFEGHHANTYEKLIETQKKYELKRPSSTTGAIPEA